MRKTLRYFTLLFLLYCHNGFSQSRLDSLFDKLDPQKFASAVATKANKLQLKLEQKTMKALQDMQKQEKKLYKKMLRGKDSLLARERLRELEDRCTALKSNLNSSSVGITARHYVPTLDSLNTALKFLSDNEVAEKVKDALAKTNLLQGKFDRAEEIKKFIKERRELLKQQLEKLGMVKQLKKINKTIYYYSAQLREYKSMLSDPKKIQRKVLEILGKTKVFQEFMKKNSMLASLFRLPRDPNDPLAQASLVGLQTRSQINNLIQQQIASGGPNAQQQVQQNIQAAQSQLSALRNKLFKSGGIAVDGELPDFKPNQQKTKSFFKRLEYGANIQTQKASNFFPVTSDMGLSVGYKLNDKSIIGVGVSYKLGLGRGWNAIDITHQGLGLRSYADVKLKGSIWISGGYEQNYKSAFSEFDQLRNRSGLQQSGLIGISKLVPLKTKFVKKASMKILWDFLSYQQVPRTQPFLFRIGWGFN